MTIPFTNKFDPAGEKPFQVLQPAQQRVPFVFNSPHSGRHYPDTFVDAARLTRHQLRASEDVLVDKLFDSVVEIGAPLLAARFPRAWLDVNREPFELDPRLFGEQLPAHANIRSMRVSGGFGTIPRLVAENLPIYREPPTLDTALARIAGVYRPYHDTLRHLIAATSVNFGHAVLVDCHSMPSNGNRYNDRGRADIIVGDRYGTSCHGEISREIMHRFGELGYTVTRNKPYAGGFITEHYGRPLKGLHAVQIEINRSIYMDEETLQPNAGFNSLAADIREVMTHLVSLPDHEFAAASIAAE